MATRSKYMKFCFLGAGIPNDFGTDGETPFRKSIVGPATVEKSSYGIELGVTAAAAAQSAEINQNNVLSLELEDIICVEFDARIDIDAGTDLEGLDFIVGLAGARDDDADLIEPALFIRIKGSDVFLESNDGLGKNVDDYDTEFDVNTGTWQRYSIDLATGVQTLGAPAQSRGGTANPLFYVSGNSVGRNSLNSVHSNQSFDISAHTGGLQLFARAAKTDPTSTNAATLSIRDISCELRYRLYK